MLSDRPVQPRQRERDRQQGEGIRPRLGPGKIEAIQDRQGQAEVGYPDERTDWGGWTAVRGPNCAAVCPTSAMRADVAPS